MNSGSGSSSGGGGGFMSATAASPSSSANTATTSSDPSAVVHDIFQKHGLVILPDYLIPNNNNNNNNHHGQQGNDFLQLHKLQAKQAFDDLSNVLQQDFGVQVDGPETFDFVEVRQRPGHRVDYRYDLLNVENDVDSNRSNISNPANDLAQRLVYELPRLLFSNRAPGEQHDEVKLRVLHAGVVHAFGRNSAEEPVPPAQIWHRDGPSLFGEENDHHDTHCFNVFIPLVDLDIRNGTTQFIPGTHVDTVYKELAPEAVLLAQQQQHNNGSSSSSSSSSSVQQEEVRQHERSIAAIVPAGSVIIFDIRLLHRGLSNTLIRDADNNGTTADRPLLYFTMARDWFREEHMFQQQASLKQQHRDKDFIGMQQEMQSWCTQLYRTVTGQTISSSYNGNTTNGNISNSNNSIKYGHPHYTLRFDLLLLEAVMALNQNEKDRTRLITTITSAVLAFCSRSNSDKMVLCQEWIQALSRPESISCKLAALAEASRERRLRQEQQKEEEEIDFTNIQQDMGDVAALYRVTARLLLKETALLPRLGFPANEFGVCFTLSLLKAWAVAMAAESSTPTSTSNTNIIIDDNSNNSNNNELVVARLEESFSSWWHAGRSRFDFQDGQAETRNERSERMLLVVFSSLGSGIARPEWKGSIRQSISTVDDGYINTSPASSVKWDVLHVLDPSFSWYTQDPTCSWQGYDYYYKQLETLLADYKGVFYLGDSMGAAAALRFSLMADAVLAFTPQVDITSYEAITRADLSLTVRQRFQQELLSAVSNTKAKITIHYGKDCAEDVRQVGLLPGGDENSGIKLVSHDFDDHVLSLHLRDQGLLTDIVKDAIEDFVLTSLR
jgi:Phytanoyl-CoA dioxygenase (PhyH)